MARVRTTKINAAESLTKKQWQALEGVCRSSPPELNKNGVGPKLDEYILKSIKGRAAYWPANVETVLRGQGYYVEPSDYTIRKLEALPL